MLATPDNSTTHSPSITVYQAGRWKMMVALADDHPLAAHACLTVEMLAGEPLVLHDTHDNHEQLYLALKMLSSQFHVAHRSGSTLSVLAIAAAGLGLAPIPAPLQQVNIPGLVYRSPFNAPVEAAQSW
jgi:DNA-binding transcriptional LysR family regulator